MKMTDKQLARWEKTRQMAGRAHLAVRRAGVGHFGSGDVGSRDDGDAGRKLGRLPVLLGIVLVGFPIGGYFFGADVEDQRGRVSEGGRGEEPGTDPRGSQRRERGRSGRARTGRAGKRRTANDALRVNKCRGALADDRSAQRRRGDRDMFFPCPSTGSACSYRSRPSPSWTGSKLATTPADSRTPSGNCVRSSRPTAACGRARSASNAG